MKICSFILALLGVLTLAAGVSAQSGKPLAENFSMPALDGRNVELEALKGKVVLITFWSTRCAICDSEIPKLNRMAAEYRDRDVVFLALTTENPTRVESFLKTKPFEFDIVPSSFGVLLKYADRDRTGNIVMGFPAYFLINQAGEIELKTNGWDKTAKLDAQIRQLLGTPPPTD